MTDVSINTLRAAESRERKTTDLWALTILFHPDISRVGEVARLTELRDTGTTELNRNVPLFCPPGGGKPRALDDRFLSRKSILLHRENDTAGAVLVASSSELEVATDGSPVQRRRDISQAHVAAGVVVELANRVVLLLHLVDEQVQATGDELGLVGAHPAMEYLRRTISRCADLPVAVLIRGETGTGKELVARAIHNASTRSDKPFVTVNMGAIPSSTAASELFGHGKGAFTGATSSHRGYFGDAEGGTLFLDEIGATPDPVQPMLLRALESGEIQPLGAATGRNVDVRIIAATDANLEEVSENNSFRAALLHRLEGFQLFLPPLRERREDIGRLMVHFLRQELELTGDTYRLDTPPKAERTWIPARLVAALAGFEWPGNVRQLRSVVRQLAISNRGVETVAVDPALEHLLERARGSASVPEPQNEPQPRSGDPSTVSDADVIDAMKSSAYVVNDAARKLGVSRSYLYNRIKPIEAIRDARSLSGDEISTCRSDNRGDLAATAQMLGVSARALRRRMAELGL